MDPTAIKPWADLVTSVGLPTLFTLGALALAWRYIPKWIDGQLAYQESMPKELHALVTSLKDLAVAMAAVQEDTAGSKHLLNNVRKSLAIGLRAARTLAGGFPQVKGISDIVRDLRVAQALADNVPKTNDSAEGLGGT